MRTTYYSRPEILARPELEQGHTVIEASAGTGKTFTLEHLVLDLLITGRAKIEEILVVTFTDAATRELRERVRALIRKICDGKGDIEPGENTALSWTIDDAVRGRLREALFRFDGAAISTIHGFCQRVLSEQAFYGGRLFEQEHADGAEMFGFAFREEARTALVEKGPVGDALREWIEEERTLHELEELLYRCHREGSPERCPVTPKWDPPGLLEAAESIPGHADLQAAGQELFTDKRTMGAYEKLLNSLFTTLAGMQDQEDPREAANIFMEWANKQCTINKEKAKQINHLRGMAGREDAPETLKVLADRLDEIAGRAAPGESFFVYELLPRVQIRLTARKLSLGLIDYDDMLLGVLEALSRDGSEALLEALRQRWKFALVDEFQDTDPVQWEIFRRIFVAGTDEHRLFVIGDPKQAIYSFRGADVYTYELAKSCLIEEHKASRLPLTKNFRSTGSLIEAINEILEVEDSRGGSFFDGLNRYDEPVECGDESRTAEEAGKPAVPVHLIHLHGGSKKLSASLVRRGVAHFIGEEILRLTGRQGRLVTGSRDKEPEPIKLSDIYILTRTAREGREIGEVLRGYGIPHAFYKQEGLFKTDEAENVHKLLCAIDAPTELAARLSAWLTPFFGVALTDLPAWREAGESHPLTGLLLEWKRLADEQAWSRLFEAIVTDSGLVRRLVFSGNERALTNYLHLFELLLAEAHARPLTLAELARGLKARIDGRKMPEGREGDTQRLETDKEAVQILTMHKAKGLEAEVVFIGGGFGTPRGKGIEMSIYHENYERRLHIGRAVGKIAAAVAKENSEENQRLMYVSMTRAKSRLYLPYFGRAPAGVPDDGSYGFSKLGGFYSKLQKQLDLLRENGRLEDKSRYRLRPASCIKRTPREKDADSNLTAWPDESLLEMPDSKAGEAERIRPGHLGVLLTSYTRMNRGKSWQPPGADEDEQAARRDEEVAGEARPASIPGGLAGEGAGAFLGIAGETEEGTAGPEVALTIPGGREAGILLHSLLEDTPAEEICNLSFEKWSSLAAVQQRTMATLRRHGFSGEHLFAVLQLVYSALKTPLYVQSRENNALLEMNGGIASAPRQHSEISFAYPIPEAFHPLLAGQQVASMQGDRPAFEAVRGYLQGLIDLVFEHDNRIYLLDWKSDWLPAFNEAFLDAHVKTNYLLQAKVYTLAVIRLLGIGREEEYESVFGGILYAFIRGMIRESGEACPAAAGEEAVWFSRPPWNEIAAWENELLAREEWGGEVIQLKERRPG